ncbi:MAG: hypothetical protein FJ303_16070 [Planctomycetes bacterium]|nr:hypothetical protein [Planctomycetota bacterium]
MSTTDAASTPSAGACAPPAEKGPDAPKKQSAFQQVKPFLAPLLITCILAGGQYHYGILETADEGFRISGTAVAIVSSILFEIVVGWLVTGAVPHLASAYITGISVGILLRSNELFYYAICSLLSNASKYAIRVNDRHLFNPSNLGVSLLLLIAPNEVAPLSLQWGNDIWVPIIILCLGSVILFTLGRLHITATYVAAFAVLSVVRSIVIDNPLATELGVLTAPSYLLFIHFMITDPKTTPRTMARQIAVTIVVAVVETVLRLCRNSHAPYYALFIVFPIANLVEIWWDGREEPPDSPAPNASESPAK